MVRVVILPQAGDAPKSTNTSALRPGEPVTGDAIAKCQRKKKAADLIGSWAISKGRTLQLWGWRDGKTGTENKHELPAPHDEVFLYGDVVLVAVSGLSSSSGATDFTVEEWSEFMEEGEEITDATGPKAAAAPADDEEDEEEDDEEEDVDGDADGDAEEPDDAEDEDDEDGDAEDDEAEEDDEADGDDGDCYEEGDDAGGGKRRTARRRTAADTEYRRVDLGLRARLKLPTAPSKRAPRWHTAPELYKDSDDTSPIRERVRSLIHSRLDQLLSPEMRIDLEYGIYVAALDESSRRGVRRHWENPEFGDLYKGVARRTLANLDPTAYVGNSRLILRLQEGEFPASRVATMTPRELYPEHWQALADEQLKRETTMLEGSKEEGSTMFTCKRCGKSRTRYWEMQTRSADEPMTIFIRCLNCGKEWRQ
jgi:DNA-directed RNA polymerase subunit M/transcription elongation factor TFIIS